MRHLLTLCFALFFTLPCSADVDLDAFVEGRASALARLADARRGPATDREQAVASAKERVEVLLLRFGEDLASSWPKSALSGQTCEFQATAQS